MTDADDPLPRAWRLGVTLALVVVLLAGAVAAYRVTQPCWPWEETGSFAGGTTCDGAQARFDTD